MAIIIIVGGRVWWQKGRTRIVRDKQNKQALVQPIEVNNPNQELPNISIVKESYSCGQNNRYAKFEILKNNSKIASVVVLNCEATEGEILAIKNDSAYFSILPGGLGGYILYGKYTNLYKLNLFDNSVVKIKDSLFTDIDVSSDLSMIVYSNRSPSKIIIRNLNDDEEKSYTFSEIPDDAQFGDFRFSPNQDKVAIAVGYGPNDERGEIYILDLTSGAFDLYEETNSPPAIKGWIDNNEISWN